MTDHRMAVVTGAAGRLGRVIVAEFRRRDFRVVSIVRTASAPDEVACDVTDETSVVAAFESITATYGRVDAFAHAVGAWATTPLESGRLDEWRRIVDVNLTSAYLCLREAARAMTGGGGLVAIASRQGADRAPGGQSAYSASKAGVIRLVEAAAAEFAHRGITARVIAPSTIRFDAGPGVDASLVARLAVDLCDPSHPEPSGALVRAYGSEG